jgi:hypothetical protein
LREIQDRNISLRVVCRQKLLENYALRMITQVNYVQREKGGFQIERWDIGARREEQKSGFLVIVWLVLFFLLFVVFCLI